MALPFLVTSSSTARRRAGPQRPPDRRHPPARQVSLALGGAKSRGKDAATRVLVLANRTTDSTQLHQQLLARHAGGPIAVTMLAPRHLAT